MTRLSLELELELELEEDEEDEEEVSCDGSDGTSNIELLELELSGCDIVGMGFIIVGC